MSALEQLLLTAPDNLRRFLEDTKKTASQHGVEFVFSGEAKVPYATSELLVSGYFVDRPQIQLAVATGKPQEDWLAILLHESCHMDQWIEQAPAWTQVFVEEREAVDWIDEWVGGRNDLPLPLGELIDRSRNVELDCERRTVEKILRYGLPIDTKVYTQKANSYVFFYNHLVKTRAWYPGDDAPYDNPSVWSAAPDFFPETPQTPVALSLAFDRAYPSAPVFAQTKAPGP